MLALLAGGVEGWRQKDEETSDGNRQRDTGPMERHREIDKGRELETEQTRQRWDQGRPARDRQVDVGRQREPSKYGKEIGEDR